jgi:hypothetical protein
MISISDIISSLNFLKPKGNQIVCSFTNGISLGRYVFEVYNSGSNKVVITDLKINDKSIWEGFSVIETKKKFPIVIHPKNTLKLNLSIGKGDEIPSECELKYSRKFLSDKSQHFIL